MRSWLDLRRAECVEEWQWPVLEWMGAGALDRDGRLLGACAKQDQKAGRRAAGADLTGLAVDEHGATSPEQVDHRRERVPQGALVFGSA